MIFDSVGMTILYLGVILFLFIGKYVRPAIYWKRTLLLFANILVLFYLVSPFTLLTTAVLASICYGVAVCLQKGRLDSHRTWPTHAGGLLLGTLLLLIIWWVLLKYNGPKNLLRLWHWQGFVGPAWLAGLAERLADTLDLISTIGLSYIFFKLVHVLVDAYRGLLPELDPVTFFNYLFFFPSFLSGPIDRYQNFARWLDQQSFREEGLLLRAAFFRIFEGVVKKFILVPLLIGYAKDFNQVHVSPFFGVNLAVSLVAYSFYIFFDFSGYSDLAIGVAMMLGFKVPENFAAPYFSPNIADFWRRWHISLSSILREYIFLPVVRWISRHLVKIPRLAGTISGYLVTFAICGLWHGNTLNFLLWGLWHGVGVSLHKLWREFVNRSAALKDGFFQRPRFLNDKALKTAVTVFSTVMTFGYVSFGWLFFNYSIDQIRSVHEIVSLKIAAQPYYFYGSSYTWGVKLKFRPISPKDTVNLDIRAKGKRWVPYTRNGSAATGWLDVYGARKKSVPGSETLYNSLPPGPYELRLSYWKAAGKEPCRIILPVTIPDYSQHANLNADDLEAKPCRIANAGWGITLQYHPPARGTKVDIEYHPSGSDRWLPYQRRTAGGRQRVTYITETADKHGLKPGVYCIRIRYTNLKKGFFSDWTELSVQIPERSGTNGASNDEIS